MRRPQTLVLLFALLALWQNDARTQPKLPTIGFMGQGTALAEGQRAAAFVQRLRELGWIEGQNVAIQFRWADGRSERSAEIASEFVRLKVDVIATVGTPQVLAAKQATASVPIAYRRLWATRWGRAWWRTWRDLEEMSQVCRLRHLILRGSG